MIDNRRGSFSQRLGIEPVEIELSENAMPDSLRAGLWDCLDDYYFSDFARYDILGQIEGYSQSFDVASGFVWHHFLRKPKDTRSHDPRQTRNQIRAIVMSGQFNEVYDFVEFMANSPLGAYDTALRFRASCNRILERELAAFRFSEGILVKISDEVELQEVTLAQTNKNSPAVAEHILRAAQLYSQRPEPDFRNSVKESISAVEAAVRHITGKKTVGVSRPLKEVEELLEVHPALREGFEKLYAFSSDEQGVRHSLMDRSNLTAVEARYMLVSCSAFANYLLSLKSKS